MQRQATVIAKAIRTRWFAQVECDCCIWLFSYRLDIKREETKKYNLDIYMKFHERLEEQVSWKCEKLCTTEFMR